MNKTKTNRKPTAAALSGMDSELAGHVRDMKVQSWEIRRDSQSHVKLYIRCVPIIPPTKISII